jgi:hypothetical protein
MTAVAHFQPDARRGRGSCAATTGVVPGRGVDLGLLGRISTRSDVLITLPRRLKMHARFPRDGCWGRFPIGENSGACVLNDSGSVASERWNGKGGCSGVLVLCAGRSSTGWTRV